LSILSDKKLCLSVIFIQIFKHNSNQNEISSVQSQRKKVFNVQTEIKCLD